MGEIGRVSVLAAFLGAPLAWVGHLLLSYFLVALGCTTGWKGTGAALVGATVLCLGAAIGAGALAYRNWRRLGAGPPEGSVLDAERIRGFMMLGGMLLAGLFGLTILLAGLGPAFVPLC